MLRCFPFLGFSTVRSGSNVLANLPAASLSSLHRSLRKTAWLFRLGSAIGYVIAILILNARAKRRSGSHLTN